ncbi:uncharacterized protein LOC141667210 [Apium graveolens]|uniref:uncharacterized protein LOC141667210 n=1 Tax=Apium graveolens TaxID=4045 RepID=UPI003D793258
MGNHKTTESEEESLFRSYPYAVYFVQSPSTLSNTNSTHDLPNPNQETARATLSHYSSSRGSNNSFLHDKKGIIVPYDDKIHVTDSRVCDVLGNEEEVDGEEDEEYYENTNFGREMGWWRYFSFRHSSSCLWICLQIVLRLLVSLGLALLVFYLATKPPTPKLSVKIAGIREFGLGEGVDASGVTTKLLTCNFSIQLVIDNKSKLFGLHIQPPLLSISFTSLPFAISVGQELYAYSDGKTAFQQSIGTKNKPMYGAGRSMQDMLESGKGLPLEIRMSLMSTFHVIFNFIRPTFHQQARCFLLLNTSYDKKRTTTNFKSSCVIH